MCLLALLIGGMSGYCPTRSFSRPLFEPQDLTNTRQWVKRVFYPCGRPICCLIRITAVRKSLASESPNPYLDMMSVLVLVLVLVLAIKFVVVGYMILVEATEDNVLGSLPRPLHSDRTFRSWPNQKAGMGTAFPTPIGMNGKAASPLISFSCRHLWGRLIDDEIRLEERCTSAGRSCLIQPLFCFPSIHSIMLSHRHQHHHHHHHHCLAFQDQDTNA